MSRLYGRPSLCRRRPGGDACSLFQGVAVAPAELFSAPGGGAADARGSTGGVSPAVNFTSGTR